MHGGMQYDPIEVGNTAIFESYLLRHLQWKLAADRRLLN